jgi:hypothetical protein
MNQAHVAAEMGRIRREEAMARASNHRLAKIAKHATSVESETTLSRAHVIVFRRALKIAALSVVMASAGVFFF